MSKFASIEERILNDEITEDIASEGLRILYQKRVASTDYVLDAAIPILLRITRTWHSVHVLSRHTKNEELLERVTTDVGALFRIAFEAFLQLAYILSDPSKQLSRATLFLDFEMIEKIKLQERLFQHDTSFSRILKMSPLRSAGEVALQAAFDRVKMNYVRPKYANRPPSEITPARVRDHWYDADLRSLATEVGYEAEYDLWVAAYHCCIHSSISGCKSGLLMDIQHASFWMSQIVAHATKLCLEYANANLSGLNRQWLEHMTANRLGTIPSELASQIIADRESRIDSKAKRNANQD